jgi:ATP-dependent Clp protease ATP-binding subunit ClpX
MKAGNAMGQEKLLYCHFCGRDHKQLRMLVAGESANICDDCALEAVSIFAREAERKERESSTKDSAE